MDPLSDSQPRADERIAFVTGKLAEPALSALLARLGPESGFEYTVVRLNIAVAALMTAEWVARKIELPDGITRAVVPGHCRGDFSQLSETTGVPFQHGPKDLRELPNFFGRELLGSQDYGKHELEIVAEINHVPRQPLDEVLRIARRYRDHGADLIDLGCDPGPPFQGIGDTVRALKDENLRVSVDSLSPREIVPAVEAGAELVLSVNSSNVREVRELGCEFVAIPDEPSAFAGLETTLTALEEVGARYRIDPILEPIGFGFANSIGRYLEVRERYPDAEILMGVGNLTELTGVDSAGVNVMLLGFCAEVGIRSVLTTEVAPWTRSAVAELDVARRLMHYAINHKELPKHLEPDLHILRDENVLRHGPERLIELARGLRDQNFRLFAEDGKIHALNSDGRRSHADAFELFEKLGVTDASHAFYLGYEMAKASIALTLGKNYTQDQALRWGLLTVDEASFQEKRHKLRLNRRRAEQEDAIDPSASEEDASS